MKKCLAAKLAIASASLVLVLTTVHAADNPSPSEKAKPINPVAKPAIAKPSDALVPKTKDGANQATPAASQTPAGRPINDLKVMTGSPNTPKASATPAVSNVQAPSTPSPATGNAASAADPLEEKVRNLLQDRLGKDGEVVLRVSPDTPVGKSESGSAATSPKNRSGASAPVGSAAEASKSAAAVQSTKPASEPIASDAALKPWDWKGPRGPEAWGRLDPSYAACSSGKMQSPPLMLESQIIPSMGPALPDMHWKPQGFHWTHQGPLWTARLDAGSSSNFRGQSFALEAIQFRIPGEPFIGDKPPAGSIHFIHRLEGRFLIIAVSVEIDDKAARQPAINSLLRRFPFDTSESLNWKGLTVDPQALLPKPVRAGVLFSGSLSHPPCTESALWLLAQNSIAVPRAQWTELAKLLGEGARPLQPAHGRPFIRIRGLKPE
ncbi:MAG: hypothetical protein FJY62_00095 [Betaproteobacteria bacterium]|nr:hypothetical protein [Betaproteobacteria bacterium]